MAAAANFADRVPFACEVLTAMAKSAGVQYQIFLVLDCLQGVLRRAPSHYGSCPDIVSGIGTNDEELTKLNAIISTLGLRLQRVGDTVGRLVPCEPTASVFDELAQVLDRAVLAGHSARWNEGRLRNIFGSLGVDVGYRAGDRMVTVDCEENDEWAVDAVNERLRAEGSPYTAHYSHWTGPMLAHPTITIAVTKMVLSRTDAK